MANKWAEKPSYDAEARVLASLCERCEGKCCMGHHIVLSRQEFQNLKKVLDFPQGRIDSPTGVAMESIDAVKHRRCPFLGTKEIKGRKKTSCILEGDMKPLVCRMFPVTFALERGRIEYFLSKKCPFAGEVSALQKWIDETVRISGLELGVKWSGKELRCFGIFLKKNREDFLDLPGR